MRTRITALVAAAALLLVAHPSTSRAQDVMFITADFPFVVQGQTMPPGTYVLRLSPEMTEFTLTRSDGAASDPDVAVKTMTRLASMQPPRGEAHVTFDHRGDTYYLSEIWMPDQDGWLVYATRGARSHAMVKGANR